MALCMAMGVVQALRSGEAVCVVQKHKVADLLGVLVERISGVDES